MLSRLISDLREAFVHSPASYAKRVGLWALSLVIIVGCYGVGKLELLREPQLLELSAIDRAVPLVAWTVWLYGTIRYGALLAWLTVPDRRDAARLLSTVTVASVACMALFVIWPTTFPRELFPLPEGASASLRELAELRASDSPTNCLPSLHVALAWGIALTWASWLERKWLRALPLAWALVVSVATVTTKQHFFIDVPTGAAIGALAWWTSRRLVPSERATPAWMHRPGLVVRWPEHQARLAKLRANVEGHQWALEEIDWPEGPLPPLDPSLVRLINELIYIEEIAGFNFSILAQASADDDLETLYTIFADEERRHAEGLRRVLELHGAPLRPPGLGNTLVLDEFDALDPASDADVYLIAVANPVFETMLDAGTVPFLRTHPALQSPWFEDFVKRITRDEAAHLTVNWTIIREAGETYGGFRGLRFLFNPSVYRGMIAVPFMSLDVYSLAHKMGYQFRTLLPAFGKLWRLHRRWNELSRFPLWWVFRLFVLCGALATFVSAGLQRAGLIFVGFWVTVTKVTDAFARVVWGRRLLAKRGLPAP